MPYNTNQGSNQSIFLCGQFFLTRLVCPLQSIKSNGPSSKLPMSTPPQLKKKKKKEKETWNLVRKLETSNKMAERGMVATGQKLH